MSPHQELARRVSRAQRAAKAAGLRLVPADGGAWSLSFFAWHRGERCALSFPSIEAAEGAIEAAVTARAELRAQAAIIKAQGTARRAAP
jgi:hypothetical protein